jgi:serine/threonine protein kinase
MLVMEFMSRGSLSSVLRQKEKIPLRRKLEMACQIASGMRKLHAHHMIHRDIRPDNILVTQDYTAKIGDMGLARVWLPDENLTLIGCVAYMPFDFYTGKYDQSLDVYTFGLTINELFTEKRHQFNLLTRRVKLTNYSPVFADLIARCMHNEPSQRPSAIEIETTLRMYKQAVEKYIIEKNIKYADMSTEDKNLTFITSYYTLHPEIDELLKHKFPPTPTRTDRKLTVSTNKEYISDLLQRLGDP